VTTNGRDLRKVSKQKSVLKRGTKPLPNFVLPSVQKNERWRSSSHFPTEWWSNVFSYWSMGPFLEEFACIMYENKHKTFTLQCSSFMTLQGLTQWSSCHRVG